MADDWINIALRFAVYMDLAATFGVALFGVYALRLDGRSPPIAQRYARAVAAGAILGIVLSACSMAVLAKAMSGAESYGELTSHIFEMVISETPVGVAWTIRLVALAACAGLALSKLRIAYRLIGAAALSAMALATMAWSGHGAMSTGAQGYLHLASDIAHLLAAGAWVGALLAFVMLATQRAATTAESVELLSRLSNGFAQVGTVIVATLLVTGIGNYLLIVGASVTPIFTTLYGGLLALKLALFVGMLGLAAANRFQLSPRLELALSGGDHAQAAVLLRRSLVLEASMVVLVIACVAWLGVLSPGK
ncbi:TPA: copper homeostasis membrane protein CopD [Pseudomonas aeruginosa]|nr:copper homeostasis membrane protein CopD [Pseudomonas aeruginosa]